MKRLSGPFFLFCAFTLAGTSAVAARYVSGRLGPFTITAVSQLFALIFLLPISIRRLRKTIADMSGKDFLLVLLQAFFGMFLFRMFFLNGLKLTSTTEAGILTGATPAVTAMLAVVLLKEPIGIRRLAGILSTVTGIVILQGVLTDYQTFITGHFWGNILVLCAAVSESLFNILSRMNALKKDTSAKREFSPLVQTTLVSSVTLLLCLIPAALEHTSPFTAGIGLRGGLSLLWYGAIVTALAFYCWYSGIKRCSAVTAAAFSGMMPFTCVLLSVTLLEERPGLSKYLGGVLIIAGMIIIGNSKSSVSTELYPERKKDE